MFLRLQSTAQNTKKHVQNKSHKHTKITPKVIPEPTPKTYSKKVTKIIPKSDPWGYQNVPIFHQNGSQDPSGTPSGLSPGPKRSLKTPTGGQKEAQGHPERAHGRHNSTKMGQNHAKLTIQSHDKLWFRVRCFVPCALT